MECCTLLFFVCTVHTSIISNIFKKFKMLKEEVSSELCVYCIQSKPVYRTPHGYVETCFKRLQYTLHCKK
jgi:hypothetical protein